MSNYINDEERRYKIQERISYESEIEKVKKNYIAGVFLIALGGLVAVLCVTKSNADDITKAFSVFGSSFAAGLSFLAVINSIKKKAKLEGKIEVIDEELKTFLENYTDDKEENRGMKL